jgi:hypothetical protein
MKLREQALLKVEPQVFVPTTSRTSMTPFPWKTSIVTTVSGLATAEPGAECEKLLGRQLDVNYGGFDTPDAGSRRISFRFRSFRDKIHLCALPNDEHTGSSSRKPPW